MAAVTAALDAVGTCSQAGKANDDTRHARCLPQNCEATGCWRHGVGSPEPVLTLTHAAAIRASDERRGSRIGEFKRLRDRFDNEHNEATAKPKTDPRAQPRPLLAARTGLDPHHRHSVV